jgi:methionyl-tRNA formyltransferase
MRIVIIGRAQWLFEAAQRLIAMGQTITSIITAKASEESRVRADDYAALAAACGAKFYRSIDASRKDILENVETTYPDLGLTMNFPGILKSEFISMFPWGVVNCHGSLLPKYRGNSPPNWGILNGDAEAGCTFHLVRAGELDNGPILLQKRMSLDDTTYISDIYDWFDQVIPEGFVEVAEGLKAGRSAPMEQDQSEVTESFPRRPEDAKINFEQSTREILRLIRASSRPFSGAYCFGDAGAKLTIWRASPSPLQHPTYAAPGQILGVDSDGAPRVKTSDGAMRIDEWTAEGDVSFNRRSRLR